MTGTANLTFAGAEPTPASPAASPPMAFQVYDDLAVVEPLWRALEAEGVGSPYQRFDWVRSYAESLAAHERFEPRVVLVRGPADRPMMLLPLAIRRRRGIRVAAIVGGKHANYHLPVLAPDAPPLPPEAVRALLAELGRALRVDLWSFVNLPVTWQGRPNPLALPTARPNPSDAYRLTLDATGEDTLKRALDKDARKKLRQKERYLAALGPVTHRVAQTPAEVDRVLDAYFAQKAARFRALGLPADIEDAPMRAFIRRGCLAGLAAGRPAVELHALEAGDRVVAVFGLAADRRRAAGMFISFDGAAETARCSPGDLLVARVIAEQCRRGRRSFDLGVGEARYKSTFCGEVDPLVALALPVTLRGRAYAGALRGLGSAKRLVKRTPWAWRAVGALRAARAKFRA